MSAVQFPRPVRRGAAVLALALGLSNVASAGLAPEVEQMGPEPTVGPAQAAPELAQAENAAPGASVSPLLRPAPKLFEAAGTAVWDGRRTLQGVWVAHPLATSARRVRIFNTATGSAVDGALFKRDPGLTGPSVLISSQAAELLGMPPGEEVELRIVALTPVQRHELIADAPAVAEPAAVTQLEATAKAPDDTPITTRGAGETMAAVPSAGSAVAAPAPAETGAASITSGETHATLAAAPPPASNVLPATPLPPRREDPPAATPSPEPALAAAPPPSTPEPAPPAPPEQAADSSLSKPYVQAGTFGVAENATRLIAELEAANVPAEGKSVNYGGREMTRVLAGPFATTAERDAALRMIREMGLGDALPVAR